jgi:hypothetical protein
VSKYEFDETSVDEIEKILISLTETVTYVKDCLVILPPHLKYIARSENHFLIFDRDGIKIFALLQSEKEYIKEFLSFSWWEDGCGARADVIPDTDNNNVYFYNTCSWGAPQLILTKNEVEMIQPWVKEIRKIYGPLDQKDKRLAKNFNRFY